MKKIFMLLIGIVLTSSLVGCSCSKQFTVTFDSNGGSEVESQTINVNGTATEPTEPTRDGYVFEGWLLDNEPFDFSTPITEDITLVASWSEAVTIYTVSFDVNGDIETVEVEEGRLVNEPEDPEVDGYEFIGWYLDDERFDFSTPITEDITLVAEFRSESGSSETQRERFTVTFDSNGGSRVASQTVTEGNRARRPENPTREGYVFVSWQLDGEDYNFNTRVTSNITLVAVWEEIPEDVESYTVTFDSNGGSSVSSQTVIEGSRASEPEAPTREGYTFIRWELNGEAYDFNTRVTSNITLVAVWEEVVRYTVTFDSNGGSSVSSQTVVEGNAVNRPSNPTREGYTFVSWQLNGETYDFSSPVTSNITLVANWEKVEDEYSIRFTTYDDYTPAGTIQVFKNGDGPIAFTRLLDANNNYVGKYDTTEMGMKNGNSYVVGRVAKVELTDGTIVNISR